MKTNNEKQQSPKTENFGMFVKSNNHKYRAVPVQLLVTSRDSPHHFIYIISHVTHQRDQSRVYV